MMTDDEHHRYIFEKLQRATDEATDELCAEQPALNRDRMKRLIQEVMGAYLRKERNASMTSGKEYEVGLQEFLAREFPGKEPRVEYEGIYELQDRILKKMGWGHLDLA